MNPSHPREYNSADVAALMKERDALAARVVELRTAVQRAADQLRCGEWNSHNSGTWTILSDALARPDPSAQVYAAAKALADAFIAARHGGTKEMVAYAGDAYEQALEAAKVKP